VVEEKQAADDDKQNERQLSATKYAGRIRLLHKEAKVR
jgi:hypothetical protein